MNNDNERSVFTICIAKDFSDAPGARYRQDGPKSGEEFFEEMLDKEFEAAKKGSAKLIVNFDGAYGYATSFLSECFGLLTEKYGKKDVLAHLEFISSEDPLIINFVHRVIEEG